jgi:ATP-dependent RNA helicase RhlE
LLTHLIKANDWHQGAVHAHEARREPPVEHPLKQGITAMAIHGNKSQTAARRSPTSRRATCRLVATDIAARGIDIDQLPHVVNFWIPTSPRTTCTGSGAPAALARLARRSLLVSVDENIFLRDIERLIRHEIPKEIVPGFAPLAHERPEPIVLGRMVIGEGAGRGGARPRRDGPASSRSEQGRGRSNTNGANGARSNGAPHGANRARSNDAQAHSPARPAPAPRRDEAPGAAVLRRTTPKR